MICVIKHKKSGEYILAAGGKVDPFTRKWTGDTKIQFYLTKDINKAKRIEDPDWSLVDNYECEIVPIKINGKVEIVQDGYIY